LVARPIHEDLAQGRAVGIADGGAHGPIVTGQRLSGLLIGSKLRLGNAQKQSALGGIATTAKPMMRGNIPGAR
jgi:hypothetical protein